MISRRFLLAASPWALTVTPRVARADGNFSHFLAQFRAKAIAAGIGRATLDRALAGVSPDPRVIALDRRQPEFTQTWAHYAASRLSPARIAAGRAAMARHRALLRDVETAYGVPPSVIVAIWGLESNYGTYTGDFPTIPALATLAWEGRRAALFTGELIAALRIIEGGMAPSRLTGSYAGAMGQPQFMPSAYRRYGVDFNGDGVCDIWTDTADVLASIARYLADHGWVHGAGWGQAVVLPPDLDAAHAGARRFSEWQALGVAPRGDDFVDPDASARLTLPAAGEAFLVSSNFQVIKSYNASDFYALVVGLLSEKVRG